MSKGNGVEDPLVKAADDFISEKKLGSAASDEIQEVTSSLKRNGVSELADLKRITLDVVKFLMDKQDLADDTQNFLRTMSVREKEPVNLDDSIRLLGAGFNILNEKTVAKEMFKYKTRDTKKGVVIPAPARFSKTDETKTFMETFETTEEMINSRMKHLNVSLGVSTSTFLNSFSALAQAGFSTTSSSSSSFSSKAKEYSFLLEQRIFEVSMGNFDEVSFTKEFLAAVQNLPAHLAITDKDNRQAFERFFDRWGHFVVTKAYGGGCVEVKVNASSFSSEKDKSFDLQAELKAAINGAVASAAASTEAGSSNTANSKAHRMVSQSEIVWIGGDKAFHKSSTLTDPKEMDKWKLSLIQNPTMLRTDMCLNPISEVVGALAEDKEKTCYDALEQFLSGKFHLQKLKEVKEEERQESLLAQAEQKIEEEEKKRKIEMLEAKDRVRAVEAKEEIRKLMESTTREDVAKAATPSVTVASASRWAAFATIGGAIGSWILPGVGTAIGAAIGGVTGAFANHFIED